MITDYSVVLNSLSVAEAEMEIEFIIMLKNLFRKNSSTLQGWERLCACVSLGQTIQNSDRSAKFFSCSVNWAPFSQLEPYSFFFFYMDGPVVTTPQASSKGRKWLRIFLAICLPSSLFI